ncbi:MAG: peptide chain release factor N(5)-glutamine methyltransferase [Bacteroidota bacterium]|jgi:release factor glutamine methyltransferase
MSKLQDLRRAFQKKVAPVHGDGEAAAMFREIYLHYHHKDLNHPDLYLLSVDEQFAGTVMLHATALEQGAPLQYVLGTAYFRGKRFHVNPDVLIPRPETEELLEWILEDYPPDAQLRILDVGTGSGCLAISLAEAFPNAQITALDVSAAALKVAALNAQELLGLYHHIKWSLLDYLMFFPDEKYDLIVSNPPYIALNDRHLVEEHVARFEPEIALFVAQQDALIFYRRISEHLLSLGSCSVYMELHAGRMEEVCAIFQQLHTTVITSSRNDFTGIPRMLKCIKKGNL